MKLEQKIGKYYYRNGLTSLVGSLRYLTDLTMPFCFERQLLSAYMFLNCNKMWY